MIITFGYCCKINKNIHINISKLKIAQLFVYELFLYGLSILFKQIVINIKYKI